MRLYVFCNCWLRFVWGSTSETSGLVNIGLTFCGSCLWTVFIWPLPNFPEAFGLQLCNNWIYIQFSCCLGYFFWYWLNLTFWVSWDMYSSWQVQWLYHWKPPASRGPKTQNQRSKASKRGNRPNEVYISFKYRNLL